MSTDDSLETATVTGANKRGIGLGCLFLDKKPKELLFS
jgi:hypothetical protein